MRHFSILLAGGAALAAMMIGCQTERDIPEVDITTVRCSIDQIDSEEDFATRAIINGTSFLWSAGDKIGIVPNEGSQIYFVVNDGAGTSTAKFDGGDWAMKSTGTFYAYYPLYPDIFLSKGHVPVSYIGQTQSGNNNNLHAGDYWTLYTEGTKAMENTLNFSFHHLTSFFKTYVAVPAGTYTRIAFSAPSEVFIKDGYFDMSSQTPKIVGTTFTDELCLDLQDISFDEETELNGYLVLAPVDITGIPITVTVYRDGEAAYEYTLTKTTPMVVGKTYAFRATDLTLIVSLLTLDKSSVSMKVGDSIVLNATVHPSEAHLTWTSSDDSIVTVYNGAITALRPGEAVITVQSGEKSAQCNVNVSDSSTGIGDWEIGDNSGGSI